MILRVLLGLVIAHLCVFHVLPVAGQTASAAETNVVAISTTESLLDLSTQVQKAKHKAEAQKASTPDAPFVNEALSLLSTADEQLQTSEQSTTQVLENERAVREAPAILERIKAELEKGVTETTATDLPSSASADIVNQHLDQQKANLDGLAKRANEVEAEQERKNTRLAAIPKELAEVRSQLTEADIELRSMPTNDEPLLAEARQLNGRAKLLALTSRQRALELEQARYNAREEFLPLARQLISEQMSTYEAAISSQTEFLNDLRRREVAASAKEIKQIARQADKSHPLIRAAAAENSSITEELNLSNIVEEHERLLDKLAEIKTGAAKITRQDESLRSKFKAVGYSDALGLLLMKQRAELPHARTHRNALELRETLLAETNLKSLEIQDSLDTLPDPARIARELTDNAGIADDGTTSVLEVRRELTALLQARKEYLLAARDAYENLFQTLIELNSAEEDLVRTITSYSDFIDERILWLPSASRVTVKAILGAGSVLVAYISVEFWKTYLQIFISRGLAAPFAYLFGALLLILILLSRHRWKKKLADNLELASKNRLASFKPLVQSLWYALLYIMPLPLLVVLAGLPLVNLYSIPVDHASFASGLVRGGIMLFLLLYANVMFRRKGIAETFFSWQYTSVIKLRHTFSSLVWFYFPAVILVRAAQVSGTDEAMEVARFALVVLLLVIAILFARLLHPARSVFLGSAAYKPVTWLYKLRYVVFAAVVVGPFALSVAALMGYVYTVIEIGQRLNVSFWLGAGAILLNETVFFWILVKRRKLAVEEARKRRETAKSQQRDTDLSSADLPTASPEPSLDIAAISQQAGRLLHVFVLGLFIVGLWAVWAGVLPALKYLDTQPLWSVSRQVTEDPMATGAATQLRETLVPVTLADLLLVVLVIFIAVAALRNIPGLLDITVFRRFSVQAGERYAFNTLIRYLIIIIGLIYVFYQLGLQWKQIQWLAAAVSVGLGFGLQEIFANFVSGLILLFERPVRVGDIVTVGDVTGRVTQIRIRATTIVNWDHKEHLIPNKELITGQVLNWTLSDQMVRLLINLEVAHGSDYNLAREILMKIAKENPHTMDDPAPVAAIEKFNASGVQFFLAVHLPNLDNMTDVRHDMMTKIEKDFREAGIYIPMPQMNVKIERQHAKPT